jgi:hypothetical protein
MSCSHGGALRAMRGIAPTRTCSCKPVFDITIKDNRQAVKEKIARAPPVVMMLGYPQLQTARHQMSLRESSIIAGIAAGARDLCPEKSYPSRRRHQPCELQQIEWVDGPNDVSCGRENDRLPTKSLRDEAGTGVHERVSSVRTLSALTICCVSMNPYPGGVCAKSRLRE